MAQPQRHFLALPNNLSPKGYINDDNDARQKAINDAAAASYEQWRQARYGPPNTPQNQAFDSAQDTATNAQAQQQIRVHQALSGQMGFTPPAQNAQWNPGTQRYEIPDTTTVRDTWNPSANGGQGGYIRLTPPGLRSAQPTTQQLQSNFAELPTPQKAELFQSGQAPYIDPQQGMKYVDSLGDNKEKALMTGINPLIEGLAKGDIEFNPDDRKFYQWKPDPSQPIDSGIKKKVPIGPVQVLWMKEAMKRGLVPDIDSYSKNPATNVTQANQIPQGLNNVAQTLGMQPTVPTENLGAIKPDIAYPDNAVGDSSSQLSLYPTGPQPSQMQLGTNYGYKGTMGIPNDPTQQTPAMIRAQVANAPSSPIVSADPAMAAGQKAAQFLTNQGNGITPIINGMSDNFDTDINNAVTAAYNLPNQAANTGIRFWNGLTGSNVGQIGMYKYQPDVNLGAQPAPGPEAQDAALRVQMASILANRRQNPVDTQ